MKHYINKKGKSTVIEKNERESYFYLDDRRLSIIVFSLFSSWILAFLFQGQILYSFIEQFDLSPEKMIISPIIAHFIGLFSCGFFIKSIKSAKYFLIGVIIASIILSLIFFLPPSFLWMIAIILASLLSGGFLAAWGFFFKDGTPKNNRIKTAADGLIYSNILMIIIEMVAIHLSARIGLALSILILFASLLFALRLTEVEKESLCSKEQGDKISVTKPVTFLCLFVIVITINSGLMYQVINPVYSHLKWLTSLYWAVPYIIALYIMRNLPKQTNRTYILYIAIAMIGFSFISFMILNNSAFSYLVVNTLMLGAFGVYDLFWWSILGEILDFHDNPPKIFGIGISSNVLGILLGSLIGNAINSIDVLNNYSTMLALGIVCVTFVILPPLHKTLSSILNDHAYLVTFSNLSTVEQEAVTEDFTQFANLSDRETEVASLLLERKTYRMIGEELFISENTVKYYVKNIYSKFDVHSRSELIEIILKNEDSNCRSTNI